MAVLDLESLPLDSEAMLAGLRTWVECESPTWNAAAVNQMMDLATRDLVELGARVERIPGTQGFGDCVRARLGHPIEATPGILILGHMDTVHPVGTLRELPCRREGDRCYGPGILDMKSGNYLALEAIRQLQALGIIPRLPVTVLFTSDEEVGSPSTRKLVEAEAQRHKYVLIPEPARPDGSVVIGRHAVVRFLLTATGTPAHAGHEGERGTSAIRELAEKIPLIEEMSNADVTCSVGTIEAGRWSNCVSTRCTAELLVMAKTQDALAGISSRLYALAATRPGAEFKVDIGPSRPPWVPDDNSRALHRHARAIAAGLGLELGALVSGGGSDGNFTGSLGVPTLDGLGARGAMLHTLQEHVVVDSLAERGRVFAGVLATLD